MESTLSCEDNWVAARLSRGEFGYKRVVVNFGIVINHASLGFVKLQIRLKTTLFKYMIYIICYNYFLQKLERERKKREEEIKRREEERKKRHMEKEQQHVEIETKRGHKEHVKERDRRYSYRSSYFLMSIYVYVSNYIFFFPCLYKIWKK